MPVRRPLDSQFIGWLREHRNILLKIAGSFATEAAEQADLFQDMAIAVWRSLPGFNGQSKPSTSDLSRLPQQALRPGAAPSRNGGSCISPMDLVPELSSTSPLPGRLYEKDEILRNFTTPSGFAGLGAVAS